MTKTYKQLLEERNNIEQAIKVTRESEMANVLIAMKELIAEYAIKPDEIYPHSVLKNITSKPKVNPPKYKCPSTGATWTGKGRIPNWIKGQDKSQYLINSGNY